MKTRERIKVRLEQSRIGRSAEDVWFYSDISQDNQPLNYQKKSGRTDRQSIIQDKTNTTMPERSFRMSSEKEHAFVVDWQIADVM